MTDITSLTRFTDGSIAGRHAGLPAPLRDLHRAVLRGFLETGAAPTARWVRQTALDTGLDASATDELEAGRSGGARQPADVPRRPGNRPLTAWPPGRRHEPADDMAASAVASARKIA